MKYRALLFLAAGAAVLSAQVTPSTGYLVHNLVSDLPGVADHQDPNLVNPWGVAFSPTSPIWVGNNGTGTSTLYDGTGTPIPLVVKIPAAGGATTPGPVTGVVFNPFGSNTGAFAVTPGNPGVFLFCSEDGVISGWSPAVDRTNAKVLADRSSTGAVYKGCAVTGPSAHPIFLAANFNSGRVDAFDAQFNLGSSALFNSASVPSGYAPFNVQVVGGRVYVTYAMQSTDKHDDVPGVGHGYVAVYDTAGNLLNNLIAQGPLNSPWGVALAPASFGMFGGDLLVGNFGDGKINAFEPRTGQFVGSLAGNDGQAITIQGLWSINFGNGSRNQDTGTLYFTAGIGGGPNNDPVEKHGLLGTVQAPAAFQTSSVVNGASFLAGPIAPNTWTTIKGAGLSAQVASWDFTGTTLPTSLKGVTVTVNGEPAPVSYVSGSQINFLVPADITVGTNAKIQVVNNNVASGVVTVPVNALAPAFFVIGTNAQSGNNYIAATHADGSLIGPAGLLKSAATTPAKPGETIVLYGTGFGPTATATPNGQVISAALDLPLKPTIVIDGYPADVAYAGLTGTGLYQFNVVVPSGVMTGDVLVVGLLANGETQPNAYITVAP